MRPPLLDDVLAAVADPTRRALLDRLRAGDAPVSRLAVPFGMTLTGIRKHIAVLEAAGLVVTRKAGRTRQVSLRTGALADVEAFLAPFRGVALERFDAAASYIDLSDMDVT